MNRQRIKTPSVSQHYVGWNAPQIFVLFPVAGEVFLLTFPFIEPHYRQLEVLGSKWTITAQTGDYFQRPWSPSPAGFLLWFRWQAKPRRDQNGARLCQRAL